MSTPSGRGPAGHSAPPPPPIRYSIARISAALVVLNTPTVAIRPSVRSLVWPLHSSIRVRAVEIAPSAVGSESKSVLLDFSSRHHFHSPSLTTDSRARRRSAAAAECRKRVGGMPADLECRVH